MKSGADVLIRAAIALKAEIRIKIRRLHRLRRFSRLGVAGLRDGIRPHEGKPICYFRNGLRVRSYNALNTATSVPYVGYLGINDAANVNRGINILKFNFNVYSVENVETGYYAFWDHEHVLYLPTLSGTALSVVQQLESHNRR